MTDPIYPPTAPADVLQQMKQLREDIDDWLKNDERYGIIEILHGNDVPGCEGDHAVRMLDAGIAAIEQLTSEAERNDRDFIERKYREGGRAEPDETCPYGECSLAGIWWTRGHSAEVPEVCICAAVKLDDGRVIRGHRHSDCFRTLNEMLPKQGIYPAEHGVSHVQGFVTSRNRFVSREEGRVLQDAAGVSSADPGGYRGDDLLFSEDLY